MGSKIDLITGASSEFALLTADAVGQIHASENVAVVLFDAEVQRWMVDLHKHVRVVSGNATRPHRECLRVLRQHRVQRPVAAGHAGRPQGRVREVMEGRI